MVTTTQDDNQSEGKDRSSIEATKAWQGREGYYSTLPFSELDFELTNRCLH